MTPNPRTCSRTNRPRQRPSSQKRQPSPLLVTSLGGTGIWSDSRSIQIGWKRALTLFYFLLEHPDGARIDTLGDQIWFDSCLPAASSVRTAVYHLRNAFGADIVIGSHGRYRLNRDAFAIRYDAELFMRGSDPATMPLKKREQTLSIYKGPFLPELDAPWAETRRAEIEQRYSTTLLSCAAYAESQQHYDRAIERYRLLLTLDALDEHAHAGLMRCYAAAGRPAAAIMQFHRLRAALRDELGLEPAPHSEPAQLFRALLQVS